MDDTLVKRIKDFSMTIKVQGIRRFRTFLVMIISLTVMSALGLFASPASATSVSFTTGLGASAARFGHDVAHTQIAPAAVSRATIAATANAEVGTAASSGQCQKYGPLCDDWCAMFATWVWERSGVVGAPRSTYVATAVGKWGVDRGLFKARPAGGRGEPLPGDIVVYGAPGSGMGGHVSIVYSVNGDGTITTIDGNFGNKVARRVINPVTARAGANNVLISGYVTPPGVDDTSPVPPVPVEVGSAGPVVSYAGTLQVFARGEPSEGLFQRAFDGQRWVDWFDLTGKITGTPVAVVYGNTLQVFVRGEPSGHLFQRAFDGQNWQPWKDLGGIISGSPTVVTYGNTLQVFARGEPSGHLFQLAYDGHNWQPWKDLDGIISGSPAVTTYRGTLQVFVRGEPSGHLFQRAYDGQSWRGWEDLGGIISGSPAVTTYRGTLQVFVRGEPSGHLFQRAYDGHNWRGWEDLGGIISGSPAVSTYGETLQVFVRGEPSKRLFQLAYDGQNWRTWEDLTGGISPFHP